MPSDGSPRVRSAGCPGLAASGHHRRHLGAAGQTEECIMHRSLPNPLSRVIARLERRRLILAALAELNAFDAWLASYEVAS